MSHNPRKVFVNVVVVVVGLGLGLLLVFVIHFGPRNPTLKFGLNQVSSRYRCFFCFVVIVVLAVVVFDIVVVVDPETYL